MTPRRSGPVRAGDLAGVIVLHYAVRQLLHGRTLALRVAAARAIIDLIERGLVGGAARATS